jgi:hypothetical protein
VVPPKGPANFWGWPTPLIWMISSKSLILSVICNNCKIHNNLHLSWHGKGLFQHLKGSPMDDYHEFCDAHEVNIDEWC